MLRLTQGSVAQLMEQLPTGCALGHLKQRTEAEADAVFHDMIHGRLDDHSRSFVDAAVKGHMSNVRSKMDGVTAALLLDLGIHPAALLSLARIVLLNVQNERGSITATATLSSGDMMRTSLGEHVGDWHSFGVLDLVAVLPETVTTGFRRTPLRDLVSHPVLDRFDLHVEKIEVRDRTRFIVSGVADMTNAELAAISKEIVE